MDIIHNFNKKSRKKNWFKIKIMIDEREEIERDIESLCDEKKKIARFIESYSFRDDKEVYTNGVILVPLFRVIDALRQNGEGYREAL